MQQVGGSLGLAVLACLVLVTFVMRRNRPAADGDIASDQTSREPVAVSAE